MTDDVDGVEQELFETREELVGRAEAHGYGHLFTDQQSVEEMVERVEGISDDDVRNDLLPRVERVQELWHEYQVAVVGEVAREEL